ncbi:MAG: RsmE family RNA methyltransferase [Caldisericaceae bacterium]
MPIFNISPSCIIGKKIMITDRELIHHLRNVRRIKSKETLMFFSGTKSFETILEVNEKGKIICDIKREFLVKEPSKKIAIVNAIIEKEPMEMILRLNIPYNIRDFYFFKAERSNLTLKDNNLLRFTKLALSIAEQSESCFVPSILSFSSLSETLSSVDGYRLITLDAHSENSIQQNISDFRSESRIAIIVGPEGGFTENETSLLDSKGVIRLRLASNIFRSEFAGFVAAAIIRELS